MSVFVVVVSYKTDVCRTCIYRGADKSLARPGRKQATATKLLKVTQKQF